MLQLRYLTLSELLQIHYHVLLQHGGEDGIRDLGGLESAVAQPRMTFDGNDLYETIAEKAAALGFSLIQNHPFLDGNKRVGHAAIEIFLLLNGYELMGTVDEQERAILAVATGNWSRQEFTNWVRSAVVEVS